MWVHEPSGLWIGLGEDEVDGLLARYAECEASGEWPSYPPGVHRLHPTGWQEHAAQARVEALSRTTEEAA